MCTAARTSAASSGQLRSPGCLSAFPVLLTALIALSATGQVAAQSAQPEDLAAATQPAPPLSDNHEPDKVIIERYHYMPQWQLEEAYRHGLRQGYSAGRLDATYNARTEQLLRTRDDAMAAGLQAFGQGRYDRAADLFTLAAELDNGHAASRLHAAQAMLALEQYDQAIPLIRRALDLQPKLIHLKFDLRRDYGDIRDFEEQIETLRRTIQANPDWQEGYLLLGYELLYSGQRAQAHQVLTQATSLNPTDKLAARLLKASVPLPPRKAPQIQPAMGPARAKASRA